MTVAFNTNADTYYAARRFANVLLGMDAWECVTLSGNQRTGVQFVPSYAYTNSSGTWSQFQGTLFGDGDGTGTDGKYFRAKIASTAYGMPAGTYTVFNPSGQEFAIGSSGNQTLVTWTSAKYLTFTYTPSSSGMCLWSRRSLKNTGAGNLQIIMPGAVGDGTVNTTAGTYALDGTFGVTSGNPWNPDFLTFHQNLGTHHIRWMGAMAPNTGVVQDFADRVLPTSISYLSHFLTGHEVPHELAIDFANRTGIDPWINIPFQATTDYDLKCAALYAAKLDANRRTLPEYCNETWNFSGVFGAGTSWVQYGQFTRHYATLSDASVTTAPVFYQPGHGRSVGDTIILYPTRENAYLASPSANMAQASGSSGSGVPTYYMTSGYSYTISAVDADHFTLNLTGRVTPPGLVNILYSWTAEPGCTSTVAQGNINHAIRQAALWDAFDAALGPARVVHSMASQAADASHTSGRLGASTAIAQRSEHVHVAPYYNGLYWIASMTGAGATILPRIWSSVAGTAWWAMYTSGSTPSALDILRQQGAGFIGGGGTNGTACAATPSGADGAWPGLPANSSLTDGTNYAAFILFQETATGRFWKVGTGTDARNPANVQSNAGSPVYFYDTFANQAIRGRLSTLSVANFDAHTAAIAAAGSSATLICYEGGPDVTLNGGTVLPHWLQDFFTDTTAVATMKHYYNHLARVGYRNLTHFMDINGGGQYAAVGGSGWYDFVNNQLFSNVTDPRYVMLSAYNGLIPKQSAFPSGVTSDKVATAITAAPGSFPSTVYSGLTGGYTYTIINGDWTNNFAISGTSVTMVNATGIDFTKYGPRVLTIEAADAYSSTTFKMTVPLGTAWYPADAQYVLDTVGVTSSSTLTSPSNLPFASYGASLSQVTGGSTPAVTSSSGTVSNDLLKMVGSVFANGNALPASLPLYDASSAGIPLLIAHLVDIGDQTTLSSQYEVGVGASASFVAFGTPSNLGETKWRFYSLGTQVTVQTDGTCPAKGTKAVHWCFIDPANGTVVTGINQTTGTTTTGLTIPNNPISREIRIGSNNTQTTSFSQMYHGSLMVLSRSGLTLTAAKAIVQAMQTHHGI